MKPVVKSDFFARQGKAKRLMFGAIVIFVVKSNIVALADMLGSFAAASGLFLVEKRIKTRNLQLQV